MFGLIDDQMTGFPGGLEVAFRSMEFTILDANGDRNSRFDLWQSLAVAESFLHDSVINLSWPIWGPTST